MAKRYIGTAVVRITYNDNDTYSGTVSAEGHVWRFSDLKAAPIGFGPGIAYDSPKAYDRMAASAVSFGSYHHRQCKDHPSCDLCCPCRETEGYPDAETADAIDAATSGAIMDDGTYVVRRVPK